MLLGSRSLVVALQHQLLWVLDSEQLKGKLNNEKMAFGFYRSWSCGLF
jgi:hypothetical protein